MKKFIFFLISICFTLSLSAEEGMWTLNNLPRTYLKEEYGMKVDPSWVEHVQKACLRISLGGSGAFVSSQGLVLTNHHVGAQAVYHLSKEGQDLMANGFVAETLQEELKCPNLYVDQLISIQDVTEEIAQASSAAPSPAEREEVRKATITKIKKRAQESTGLQPEVVSLYQGARYHLYLYERYTDIRLVMVPEKSIAFFGGDPDNFEYPRYDLDICFFRVYKDDKPLQVSHYLKWSKEGPQLKEPLFVIGHPGKTRRMLTSAHVKFLKEVEYPLVLQWLREKREVLQKFSAQGEENRRIALPLLFSCENSLKVMRSYEEGLLRSSLIQNKEKEEQLLSHKQQAQPWEQLRLALEKAKSFYPLFFALEGFSYGKLYGWAKHLIRLADEKEKPQEERLKEYIDAELPTLQLDLFSEEPVYKNLEKVILSTSFKQVLKLLGPSHPVSLKLLGGKGIEERVEELVASTQLGNPAYRKQLYDNKEALQNSTDPLLLLAKALDPYAREIRKKKESELESIQNESYAEIAKILFATLGETHYPDATFTLRLSIGTMKGYEEDGKYIAPTTTLGGTFTHAKAHGFKEPYDLPPSWLAKEHLIKKKTPFNFVSTNDLVGGNSGSPVINRKGELVGLIFDGNRYSNMWNFGYSDVQGRAISVHSQGILEVLGTVYGAKHLIKEVQP